MIDTSMEEARQERLRRAGMVDGLMDCLFLLVENGLRTADLRQALQQWVAPLDVAGNPATPHVACWGAPEHLVEEGMRDSYAACQQWLSQEMKGKDLAAQIVLRTFVIWPHEAADSQRRYDAFLEKALENPQGDYYPSSSEWIAAVDDLRDEVTRADAAGQAPDARLVERCLALLDTRLRRQPAPSAAHTQRPMHVGLRERLADAVALLWQRLPATGMAAAVSRSAIK